MQGLIEKRKITGWIVAILMFPFGFEAAGENLNGMPSGGGGSQGASQDVRNALNENLPVEHRRYLLYLYARLNKPKIAEELADKILIENPGDKQTLLVLASMYIERKESEKALLAGKQLARLYPKDDQALYFLGAAHYQLGHFSEANEILRKIKLTQYDRNLYPYETDLASSAYKAGDWYRAMLAYQELMRNHALRDELRQEVRFVLERIYREHLPVASWEGTYVLLRSGSIFQNNLEYSQHISDARKVTANLNADFIDLDETTAYRESTTDHLQGWLGLTTTHNLRWNSRVWLGGDEELPLGGVRLLRNLGEQRNAALEFSGNRKSTDGLLLRSLNGRENRFTLSTEYLITRSWFAYGQGYVREVQVDQESLGKGFGFSANVEHIFTHETPDLRVGYRFNYMRNQINDQPSLATNRLLPVNQQRQLPQQNGGFNTLLLLPELHRHGVYSVYRDQLSSFVYYYGSAGVDYAFERSSLEYTLNAGWTVYPRKSLEIRNNLGYTSSARTADAESDQWEFTVALSYWF